MTTIDVARAVAVVESGRKGGVKGDVSLLLFN